MDKPVIGFIGLGIMGKPMCKNLLKAGFPLVVHNRSRGVVEELVAVGAQEAHNPKEIAERSQVIITILPDTPDIEKVVLGENGVIEGVHPGQLYIDMSTIDPAAAVRVAQALQVKGVRCLDAPVSGGDIGAINATLTIMVGGEPEVFEQARPLFEALGKTITLCGPNGSGQIVKACNQIGNTFSLVGMAEALVLGMKAGIDPAIILKVLSGGSAQTRLMDMRGPRVIKGDYKPGFKCKLHYKDLNIVMKTAQELDCPLPVTGLAHELYTAMMAAGRGELDYSGIITVIEDLAGVKVRSGETADERR